MANLDEVLVSYRMFEDSTEYLGMVETTLPDIEFMTATISGAGIAGEVEEVIAGMLKSMRISLKFNTFGENARKLATPVDHNIDLREVQQIRNRTTGKIEMQKVRHNLVVTPVKIGLGTLKTASTTDPSGDYAVRYYAQYVDGQKMVEIDQLNYICVINGVDYLADVRKAMGL